MIEREVGGVKFFQFECFAGEPGLVHAVASRHGGVSAPPYDTLNLSLSVGDEPARVHENRRRFAAALEVPPERVVSAPQVHGKTVWAVENASAPPGGADILITNQPGRFLSQRFADCVPLLIWDPRRRAVAAAHAGWRGTALNVAGVAVAALSERYGSEPADLLAAIGPSIGPCCYEVGADVLEALSGADGYIRPSGSGRAYLDLWRLNETALVQAGLRPGGIAMAALCTRCQSETFFSHRAAGGGRAGRFGTLIGMLQ